mgnify:CR=1 FL=1
MSGCRLGTYGAAAFLLLILAAHAAYGQADSVLTAHREALSRLQGMIDGREALSFERAVFITENAWHGGTLDSAAFDLTLRSMAALAERAGRSVPVRNEEHERPLAFQYALYQLLKDTLKVATPQGFFRTSPYTYNIDDFDGGATGAASSSRDCWKKGGAPAEACPTSIKFCPTDWGRNLGWLSRRATSTSSTATRANGAKAGSSACTTWN